MAYTYQYINRLAQFGTVTYDLLITDDSGLLPDFRETITVADDDDECLRQLCLTRVQAYADSQTDPTVSAGLQAQADVDPSTIDVTVDNPS